MAPKRRDTVVPVWPGLILALLIGLGLGATPIRANRAAIMLGAESPSTFQPTSWEVCSSGCTYSTIGAALVDVGTGDTINVGPGTYTETLTIDKSVALVGQGVGNTILQGAARTDLATSRVVTVTAGVTVTLEGLTIRHGNGQDVGIDGRGGGVYNRGTLTLTHTSIISNMASGGAGIFNMGTLTLDHSTVGSNTSAFYGGGIFNDGNLAVSHSTLHSNTTGQEGGGIHVYSGNVALDHSTLSNNAAGNDGGGIFNYWSTVTLSYVTLSENVAGLYEGNGILNYSGIVTFSHSIFADQAAGGQNCFNPVGTLSSDGYNLDSDGTCNLTQITDLPHTDPHLGPLQNNGGPTPTYAPLYGSPAIDAIPIEVCYASDDQRDVACAQGFGCDIGAVEVDTFDLEWSQAVDDPTPQPGQAITFTLRPFST